MKRLWIAAALLLAVAALSVGSLQWRLSSIDRLETLLDTAETAVTDGTPDAAHAAAAFRDACLHTGEAFSFLAHHEQNDPLLESASLLPMLLTCGDTDGYFTEIARCRFFLEELHRAELPLPGNIF